MVVDIASSEKPGILWIFDYVGERYFTIISCDTGQYLTVDAIVNVNIVLTESQEDTGWCWIANAKMFAQNYQINREEGAVNGHFYIISGYV